MKTFVTFIFIACLFALFVAGDENSQRPKASPYLVSFLRHDWPVPKDKTQQQDSDPKNDLSTTLPPLDGSSRNGQVNNIHFEPVLNELDVKGVDPNEENEENVLKESDDEQPLEAIEKSGYGYGHKRQNKGYYYPSSSYYPSYQPAYHSSSYSQPTYHQAVQPAYQQVSYYQQPAYHQPVYHHQQQTSYQPTYHPQVNYQPSYQGSYSQPTYHQTSYSQPSHQQVSYPQVSYHPQPSYHQPSQQSYHQPSYHQPSYHQPVYHQATYHQSSYQPSYQPSNYQPSYQPTYHQTSYQPTYHQSSHHQPSYQPTYHQTSYQPSYHQHSYQPTYHQPSYHQPSYHPQASWSDEYRELSNEAVATETEANAESSLAKSGVAREATNECDGIETTFCKGKASGHYAHPKNHYCFIQCDQVERVFVKKCANNTSWKNKGGNEPAMSNMCM